MKRDTRQLSVYDVLITMLISGILAGFFLQQVL